MPGKSEMKVLSELLSAVITTFTMRAACLIALVLLVVETFCLSKSHGLFSHIPEKTNCCGKYIEKDLEWKNIISYSKPSKQCSQEAVFVTLKGVTKPRCFDLTKKSTLRAIEIFEKSKKPKEN